MIDKFSWLMIYPEIILLIMTCVICLFDLGVKSVQRGTTYALSLLTVFIVGLYEAVYAIEGLRGYGFGGMMLIDPMGSSLKFFACVAMFATLVYGRPYAADRGMLRGGEFFTLALFSLLGIFTMISANHFLVIYLGLELLTLSSYALVALRRDHAVATEAAMKYFVLGALASGFLLYGLSMIYGATGTLEITKLSAALLGGQINPQVLVFGLVFIVAGLAFKLGVVPFHMWIPDVYHGAPTAITLMIGSAPKLAAFAIVIRLLVEGLIVKAADWQQMLMVLAIGSLFVGNLVGIAQTNLKRMLAYSTISQMGFVVLGLIPGVTVGMTAGVDELALTHAGNAYSSAMFYVITYVLTALAAFGVILLLAKDGFESEEIADLSGLSQRSPLYAGVMALCLLSMTGIPPLVGFYAKFAVLQALITMNVPMYTYLAVFAVMMSLIGAFYYLRVIKVMYFDAPTSNNPVSAQWDVRGVLGLNALGLLVLGFVPGYLLELCKKAIQLSLG